MIEIALEFSGDGSTDGSQRCQIDSDQIDVLFEEAPRPTVIVMKTATLNCRFSLFIRTDSGPFSQLMNRNDQACPSSSK